MTTALQTILPLRAASLTRLMDVHCVRERTGLNEDQALALACVSWGFNIASGEADRRELRLLRSVVIHFQDHGDAPKVRADWEAVREEILRGAVKEMPSRGRVYEYIEGTDLDDILNCSATHRNNFLLCGQLKVVPGTPQPTPGPSGTPKITVESFLGFLRKRRVR